MAEALDAANSAPEVLLARAEEQAAQAEVAAAAAPSSPSLFAATHSVTARESLAVSSPLRWGGQRRAAVDAARAEAATAARLRESVRASARRAVRIDWFTLAAAEARVQITSERAARAEQNEKAVRALFDSGRVPQLDVTRASAEAALARGGKDAAEETRGAAAASLGYLLGRAPGEPLATGGDLPEPAQEKTLEQCVARAATASPEVLVQEERLRSAEARLTLARRQRLPALSAEAGADVHDPTQPGTDKYAAMTLTFPLDGPARERVAIAERGRAAQGLERERRAALAETEAAWRRSRASRLQLETLDKVALPAARQAAELSRLAYREGKIDLFRLLDAERALSEVEAARSDAYLGWGTAQADLIWFSGDDE